MQEAGWGVLARTVEASKRCGQLTKTLGAESSCRPWVLKAHLDPGC